MPQGEDGPCGILVCSIFFYVSNNFCIRMDFQSSFAVPALTNCLSKSTLLAKGISLKPALLKGLA